MTKQPEPKPVLAKLEKTFYFSNTNWWPILVVIHQDLDLKRCVKMEVSGDSGWLVLYPDAGSKTRFKNDGREPTIVDFETKVYECPVGMSAFTVGERDTVGKR